jgi:hypothetical protein
MPTDFDSSLVSIFARLNTLETHIACLNNCYSTLREHFDYVPTNSEPSSWFPMVKITISGETFHAHCDIMSEFCLMPKDVYESLSLWKLSEGGEEISLTNNTTIFPIGIAEGVFIKILGKMVSTDYLVIECVGKRTNHSWKVSTKAPRRHYRCGKRHYIIHFSTLQYSCLSYSQEQR